jgi:predicted nuclease with TOPRIM domain
MTNITHYADQELSLMFLNDEFLYKELMRAVIRVDFAMLEEVAREFFVFNDEQLEDLKETFKEEVRESNMY